MMSRTFHNMTSHYNIYFNGRESFKKGEQRVEKSFEDNYNNILPVFYYPSEEVSQMVSPEMNRALEKATKVITLHSITAKPELKKGPLTDKQKAFYNQKEYNKWIGDNYVLMGKAYVYNHEYGLAIETFRKVISDFKNDPVHYEAYFWMARAYIETKEYREAETILNTLVNSDEIPRKYMKEVYNTYAKFYMAKEDYEKAIPMLEKALEYTRDKHYKIRYTYILAQLYQEVKNFPKAISAYRRVIRMNPPYEMTFNAKINMAGSFEAGSDRGREIESLLKKMLKDDKNIEFRDQIYYALGNIDRIEGREEEAIENYKQSVRHSVDNPYQKGISYVTLGDIYYARPDYVQAQAYYDSSLQNLTEEYDQYTELKQNAQYLSNLVVYYNVYTLQDSLQHLASLPEKELNEIIDNMIEEVKRKEEEEQKRQMEEMQDMQYGMSMVANNRSSTNNNQGGQWYFYNLNAKGFGQPEFKMKWGNRKLEDNWRRKNKQTVEIIEPTQGVEESGDSISIEKQKIMSNKSREFYLKDIPFSDSAMHESNLMLEEALFNMGLVYMKELKDFDKAIKTFEEQITRYPDGENAMMGYYHLYELYRDKGNMQQANYYKSLLISKFPDSPRAKILSDPDFVQQMRSKEVQMENDYEQIYDAYQQGRYNEVINRSGAAMIKYEGEKIIPRLDLLQSLAIGQVSGKEEMKVRLDSVMARYPDHEVSDFAGRVIDRIFNESPEIKEASIVEEAKEIYQFNRNIEHYVGIAYSPDEDENQLNFNIVNFNLDNYDQVNLGIKKDELKEKKVLFITSFKNAEFAHNYVDKLLLESRIVFRDINRSNIDIFIISIVNYPILMNDQSLEKYQIYFKTYYKEEKQ